MGEAVRYQVADLLVDPGTGRVMRGATEIPLPKLSFDLLLVLIRDAPNLLSIDSLMDRVWPGVVVSPETVSQRVKLLRDALGDDPKAPRYVAGLRGRGYQLIAPLATIPVESASAVAPSRPDVPQPERALPAERPVDLKPPAPGAMRGPDAFAFASPGKDTSPITAGPVLPIRWLNGTRLRITVAAMAAAVALLVVPALNLFRGMHPADSTSPGRFVPPPHSVAVLSFVNMSGDPKEDYFADGLAEELSNSLARIRQLQVAARTSSFSFKGKAVDIPTVGRKLNVGAVLEGSVRKAGERVRITAQLINSITGFHLWSQTYDRDLRDVFALQSEIAAAVSGALKITLLADQQEQLAPGSTRNPQAFDAYLRGRYGESIQDEAGLRSALAALDEAIALDPQYAQALAFRADVVSQIANMYVTDSQERERLFAEARANVEKAVALAPDSALAFATLGEVLTATSDDYSAADAAYRRSVALEPGSAEILHSYASYAATFGRPDALTAARRAVNLDPLDVGAHANLGVVLYYAHRHEEAAAAFREATRLGNNRMNINWMGVNELAAGRAQSALKYCEHDLNFWYDQLCLAMVYHKLGRQSDAATMLEKMMAAQGDGAAYQYAEVYATWGDIPRALHWLRRAVELKDGGLLAIKTDPFLDPLRNTPEFKAILAQLNLPS
jgi:TolB-like protein/DNA-binding winged helix-turn-helix (wHTH) protein/Tfp pilus assembly protein PilF